MRDERIPIALERQFQLDAEDAVVVIFCAGLGTLAGFESDRADGLGDGGPLESKILRDGRSQAGGRHRGMRIAE